MKWRYTCVLAFAQVTATQATSLDEVVGRLDADVAAGKPLIAHVVVSLCDNEFSSSIADSTASASAPVMWSSMLVGPRI